MKFRQPASRFALVGVFVSQSAGGVRVAVTGARASVFRAKAMEALAGVSFTPAAAQAVAMPRPEQRPARARPRTVRR